MKAEITCADLLRQAEAHARAILIGTTREDMTPIAHLVKADGDSFVLGVPWKDAHEKEMTLKMLAALMREGDVIRYMVMCEAWARNATEEEAKTMMTADGRYIGDHPDRVEVVVASAVERAGKTTRVWKTQRDKRGIITDLVEIVDGGKFAGPWLELLPNDA